jgi:Tfp pilus assembly protein PilF
VIAELAKDTFSKLALATTIVRRTRRGCEAVLDELSKDPSAFAEAKMRLAIASYSAKRIPEAHAILDEVLLKDPKNTAVLSLMARLFLAESKTDQRWTPSNARSPPNPNSPQAT